MRCPPCTRSRPDALARGVRGLVTHTFSIVYGSVIRGLPFEGGDRLTTLWETAPADGVNQRSVTIHNFADWRDQQTAFDDLAAYFSGTINLADADSRPETECDGDPTTMSGRSIYDPGGPVESIRRL